MKKTHRVYYRYDQLEEFQCGMWRIVRGDKRREYIMLSSELMRDCRKFAEQMERALYEWPRSCAHNLTCENMNRIAWLGHAGCCLGCGSPEESTRAGWYRLNQGEMDLANEAAASVLSMYRPLDIAGLQLALSI